MPITELKSREWQALSLKKPVFLDTGNEERCSSTQKDGREQQHADQSAHLPVATSTYLFELKEDNEACRKAQQTGVFYLFHDLAPLLQASGHRYLVPRLSRAELEGLLGKFRQDSQRIEDSVLIGCSNQHEAWFALDLGLKSTSSIHAPLPKSEMEAELRGSFITLRQAVFQLNSMDSSL
ncbi:nucleoside diphosphate-linked moiety X motif 13-like [Onychomys torridus]|uniref:nucleoside diphosphate-linked moiety X motif 13-like n=1 Tax=Onychomys torridus TaxID=38674 RepID=UPI00167F36AE|nr:nucleoside diphosphate-linked moiety X motif 13-like [Onychomys torridus]